jgi:hypothetical protein
VPIYGIISAQIAPEFISRIFLNVFLQTIQEYQKWTCPGNSGIEEEQIT